MEELREIRCAGCGKLLGKLWGTGSVKCTRSSCGGFNVFDTRTGKIDFIPGNKQLISSK